MTKKAYRTWVTGEIVTASQLNEQIRDNGNATWVGTTPGDMDYYSASDAKTRIPIGTAGQGLKVIGGIPAWASAFGAKVYMSGAQSIPDNTDTEISSFPNESFDNGGFHVGTDNFLTVPTGMEGIYIVQLNGHFSPHATGGKLREIAIKINANTIERVSTVNPDSDTSSHTWLNLCIVKNFNSGDVIRFVVQQKSGGNLDFQFGNLTMVKII